VYVGLRCGCVFGCGVWVCGCVGVCVYIGYARLIPYPVPSLSLFTKLHTTGIGQVGLRLSNKGKKRSVVSEIYLVDEAGLMRPDSLALHSDGMVHFRQSKKGE